MTEIWCTNKPSSISRAYNGTTDGSTNSFYSLPFTDVENNEYTLYEGTDFTAEKTFDSADAGSHTVTVKLTLIGEASNKYKLRDGEDEFTISGTINKAVPHQSFLSPRRPVRRTRSFFRCCLSRACRKMLW